MRSRKVDRDEIFSNSVHFGKQSQIIENDGHINSSELSPIRYLQKVTVQDLQTRQVWHFLCNTWLKGNGDTPCKRTFNPAKKNEITSFGYHDELNTNCFRKIFSEKHPSSTLKASACSTLGRFYVELWRGWVAVLARQKNHRGTLFFPIMVLINTLCSYHFITLYYGL